MSRRRDRRAAAPRRRAAKYAARRRRPGDINAQPEPPVWIFGEADGAEAEDTESAEPRQARQPN